MKNLFAYLPIATTLALAGCFESAEEIRARETQFNGKKLSDVTQVIGPPLIKNKELAIWKYRNSYTTDIPIYATIAGVPTIVGYNTQVISQKCDYTAHLNAGRVVRSEYEGNTCSVFAPKPNGETQGKPQKKIATAEPARPSESSEAPAASKPPGKKKSGKRACFKVWDPIVSNFVCEED